MRGSILTTLPMIGVFIGFLFTLHVARAGEPIPKGFVADLQSLFNEYYPKAKFTNRSVGSIHVEFEITKFEFPPVDTTKKHEIRVQQGPKQGGILCGVTLERGRYLGQVALKRRGGGLHRSAVIDKKEFKQLLAAPYSAKIDAHLWVRLSYPSDTSDDFLEKFRTLLTDFEMTGSEQSNKAIDENGE